MTISSQVEVFNLALNAIGARDNISLPSESSREAEVCRLWYTVVRDKVLASAYWPEATDIAYLTQLAEADTDGDGEWAADDPRPGYQYVYALPSDLLRPRYLSDYSKFLITGYSENRRAIHTNSYQAIIAYTKRLETISMWDPELQMAIVYGLASHICMPLTGKPSRARALLGQSNQLIMEAREGAANMSNEHLEHVPDWIAARGYNFTENTRYYHPVGSLLSLGSVN